MKNLKNILKFCRFERVDGFGLNLEDGIALDNYRYHGQGLDRGECGLEISMMTETDKTQWKCFLGLMDIVDAPKKIPEENKKVYKHSAVLDASENWDKLKSQLIFDIFFSIFFDSFFNSFKRRNPAFLRRE